MIRPRHPRLLRTTVLFPFNYSATHRLNVVLICIYTHGHHNSPPLFHLREPLKPNAPYFAQFATTFLQPCKGSAFVYFIIFLLALIIVGISILLLVTCVIPLPGLTDTVCYRSNFLPLTPSVTIAPHYSTVTITKISVTSERGRDHLRRNRWLSFIHMGYIHLVLCLIRPPSRQFSTRRTCYPEHNHFVPQISCLTDCQCGGTRPHLCHYHYRAFSHNWYNFRPPCH